MQRDSLDTRGSTRAKPHVNASTNHPLRASILSRPLSVLLSFHLSRSAHPLVPYARSIRRSSFLHVTARHVYVQGRTGGYVHGDPSAAMLYTDQVRQRRFYHFLIIYSNMAASRSLSLSLNRIAGVSGIPTDLLRSYYRERSLAREHRSQRCAAERKTHFRGSGDSSRTHYREIERTEEVRFWNLRIDSSIVN